MRHIPVGNHPEIERVLDHITGQARRAADYWRLLRSLETAVDQYRIEINQTPAFWRLAFSALREAFLSSLCRLYDQEPKALSLGRFLETVKYYQKGYFSPAEFSRRFNGRHSLDTVDEIILDRDINEVGKTDPLVSRLWDLRIGSVAHNDAEATRLGKLESLDGFRPEEIEILLDRADRIVTQYSIIYRASSTSRKLVGDEDYKFLLSLLHKGLASVRTQYHNEICRARETHGKGRMLVVVCWKLGQICGHVVSSAHQCSLLSRRE